MHCLREREKNLSCHPWYRTGFRCDYLPTDMRLVIDGMKGEKEIYVNGEKLDDDSKQNKLDCMMREASIREHLQLGWNVIAVRLVVHAGMTGSLIPEANRRL